VINLNIEKIIEELKLEIKETVGNQKMYIAFSGGLDSTVVALLAKDTLSKEKLTLINTCFGPYSYSKGLEAVLLLANQLDLRLFFTNGQEEQEKLLYHGPNCNQCTRDIKLGKVKEMLYKGVVAVGSNQSDSWGKLGLKVNNGMYSPLLNLDKEVIQGILDYYGFVIPRIGENSFREGCKYKHLLKMSANTGYHARAMVVSNEVIHDILDYHNYEREIANVKIIGPLSKNIALINIKPLPPKEILDEIINILEKEETIDEVDVVDRPIELSITASPGIANNKNSKYWILEGRLKPEFAFDITAKWNPPSRNNKLWTFSVVDYKKL